MNAPLLAIRNVGMVSSLGLTAAATCAALRASAANPSPTAFEVEDEEALMSHQADLGDPWSGRTRLVKMAALAVLECLELVPAAARDGIPLLLCVAERERPGRLESLDDLLFSELQTELGLHFHPQHSALVPLGRPGALLALEQAGSLIANHGVEQVLIVATDSLVEPLTLTVFAEQGRLLTERNSNGFMPGEGAGAVLVGVPGPSDDLRCLGVGRGIEPAPMMSGEPLRAEGLTTAIRQALQQAGCKMHEIDFRITDLSGEHYGFKEAALAFSRTQRQPKEEFDLWHPAEGIGETGAVAGVAIIVNAWAACRKGYARGPRILLHAAADGERRAAAVLHYTGAA